MDGPCQNPGRFEFTFMAEMFYHPPNSTKGITTYTFIKKSNITATIIVSARKPRGYFEIPLLILRIINSN